MTLQSLLVAGSSFAAAVTLFGCSGNRPQPPKDPAPPGSAIQYFRFPNHTRIVELVPECNFYEKVHVGRKVSDRCCDASDPDWQDEMTFTPPDSRLAPGGLTPTKCYVRERAAPNTGTYIRNFFGCENEMLVGAEGCTPTGVTMGNGYPMNESFAISQSVDGTTDTCNCESIYGMAKGEESDPNYSPGGQGCYVALTSYTELGSEDPTAAFLKISMPENSECGVASVKAEYI